MDRADTQALLERAQAGSADALNALFERCAGKLLALIRVRMGRGLRAHLESQDILQAVLLKAFQRIDQFQRADAGSLMAWLARIAENEIRDQADHHRRQRRDPARVCRTEGAADHLADQVRSLVSGLVFNETLRRIERALDELEEPHREVIVLRMFEELSFQEIGERLGRSPDACRMLLARALTALSLKTREAP